MQEKFVWLAVEIATDDPVLAKVQREQQQDEELADLVRYLVSRVLPDCPVRRQKVLSTA